MKEPARAINKSLCFNSGVSSIKLNREWIFQNDP